MRFVKYLTASALMGATLFPAHGSQDPSEKDLVPAAKPQNASDNPYDPSHAIGSSYNIPEFPNPEASVAFFAKYNERLCWLHDHILNDPVWKKYSDEGRAPTLALREVRDRFFRLYKNPRSRWTWEQDELEYKSIFAEFESASSKAHTSFLLDEGKAQ